MAKILVDGDSYAIGSIKDDSDFDDVSSAKRGEAFLEDLQHFKSQGSSGIFVVREEVSYDSIIDDVEDTHKIGVSVVCRRFVMFGLSDVSFGYVISFRRLI